MVETEAEKIERMGMWAWGLENYEKDLLILEEIKVLLSNPSHLEVINNLIEKQKGFVAHAKMRLNEETIK